jgi:hypothetical protein
MDDAVWLTLCLALESLPQEKGRFAHPTRTVLRVGLWAILQDRPFCWACRPQNWPGSLRPRHLPHQSTLSRRWRRSEVQRGLATLHGMILRALGPLGRYAAVDGRPLPVGGASQDKDARAGRAVRGLGRGYKLHALVTGAGVIARFIITPMNRAEQTVARVLLRRAPAELTRIVGDTIFDSVPLHRVASATGRRLYTGLRQGRVGKRQQPERLRVRRVLSTDMGRRLLRSRDVVERTFARMSNVGLGFKGLPPWARRLHRATAWVSGKILLYHLYLLERRASLSRAA